MMYCDYKITSTLDMGNKIKVIAVFCEGEYQLIDGVNTYVRTNNIGQVVLMFEKSPVDEAEITAELKKALEDIKGTREIIPECL